MRLSPRVTRFICGLLFLSIGLVLASVMYQHSLDARLTEQQTQILLPAIPAEFVSASLPEEARGFPAKPGEVTPHGRRVLYWFNASEGGPVPVALKTEYGFLVLNEQEGTSKPGKPLFILASKRNQIQTFPSLQSFTHALLHLPHGTKLYRYDHCTASALIEGSFRIFVVVPKTLFQPTICCNLVPVP